MSTSAPSARASLRRCVLIAAVAVVSACRDPNAPVILGLAYPFDGQTVARLVEDDARAGSGPPVRVVVDSQTSPGPGDSEIRRAQRLLRHPGLVAVVGHGGSRSSLAAASIYNAGRVPQIVPIGTSALLSRAGEWTFPLAPSDSAQGEFLLDFIAKRLRARSVTVVYVNDEYGVGLKDRVLAAAPSHGVAIADVISCDQYSDFDLILRASLERRHPEAVLAVTRSPEMGAVAEVMARLMPDVPLVAADGAVPVRLPPGAEGIVERLYVATFWTSAGQDSVTKRFVERFRKATGRTPDATQAMAYDALGVLVAGVREVGGDPQRLRAYLGTLGRSRPAYAGITGPVTFVPRRTGPLLMARPVGGALREVSGE